MSAIPLQKKKKNVTVIQNSLSWWPRRIRHLTMEQEILGSKSQAGLVEPVPAQNSAATHAHHTFFFVLYDAWVGTRGYGIPPMPIENLPADHPILLWHYNFLGILLLFCLLRPPHPWVPAHFPSPIFASSSSHNKIHSCLQKHFIFC